MHELRRRLFILFSACGLIVFLMCIMLITQKISRKGTIVIGGKNNTEQAILGEMLAILIEERSDLKVKRNLNLDGSFIAFNALRNGDIDLYVEYTGTLEHEILKGKELEEFDIELGQPLGFSNNYVVLVNNDTEIQTLTQWAKNSKISFACDAEFTCRSEYELLCSHYAEKEYQLLDYSMSLLGLKSKQLDSCISCSTSAFIQSDGFRMLDDDKEIFPKYDAVPIIRKKCLCEHPVLNEIVNILSHSISTEEMRGLNYEVDINGKNVYKLSLGWLVSHGLIGVKENGPVNESSANY